MPKAKKVMNLKKCEAFIERKNGWARCKIDGCKSTVLHLTTPYWIRRHLSTYHPEIQAEIAEDDEPVKMRLRSAHDDGQPKHSLHASSPRHTSSKQSGTKIVEKMMEDEEERADGYEFCEDDWDSDVDSKDSPNGRQRVEGRRISSSRRSSSCSYESDMDEELKRYRCGDDTPYHKVVSPTRYDGPADRILYQKIEVHPEFDEMEEYEEIASKDNERSASLKMIENPHLLEKWLQSGTPIDTEHNSLASFLHSLPQWTANRNLELGEAWKHTHRIALGVSVVDECHPGWECLVVRAYWTRLSDMCPQQALLGTKFRRTPTLERFDLACAIPAQILEKLPREMSIHVPQVLSPRTLSMNFFDLVAPEKNATEGKISAWMEKVLEKMKETLEAHGFSQEEDGPLPTPSSIIPALKTLVDELVETIGQVANKRARGEDLQNLHLIESKLSKLLKKCEEDEALKTCTFLDPRHKMDFFTKQATYESEEVTFVFRMASDVFKITWRKNASEKYIYSRNRELTAEINSYLERGPEKNFSNPLAYWEQHGASFPMLFKMATALLCIPMPSKAEEEPIKKGCKLFAIGTDSDFELIGNLCRFYDDSKSTPSDNGF